MIKVDSVEFARVLANGLIFCVNGDRRAGFLLQLGDGRVTATGTQAEFIGRDWCEALTTGRTIEVTFSDREDIVAAEQICREDRKGTTTITLDGYTLKIRPTATKEGREPFIGAVVEDPSAALWDRVDDVLRVAEAAEPAVPQVVAFSTELMAKFARVKAPRTMTVADLKFQPGYSPTLVKIGPTFVGAIQPINREVNAANEGADGLWAA